MIALPTFRGFLGGIDSDVATFAAATGATDLGVMSAFAGYLKAESLWNFVRFSSFKSTQNYPTGQTVKMLGGWNANDIALFGSVANPTTSGRAFDATNDRGEWNGTGAEALNELFVFDRQAPVAASAPDSLRLGLITFGNFGDSKALLIGSSTASFGGETTYIGLQGAETRRLGSASITWAANESVQVVSRFSNGGAGQWKSKTAATMDKAAPVGVTDFRPSYIGWTADSIFNINALEGGGGSFSQFTATTRIALLFCKTSLTQTQRETITDYLDAL